MKAAAKKGADKIKTEADAHGKRLIKESGSNPIKKKLAEIAAKKYNEEVEKKADDIMKKAHEQAEKLR